jgi:hypothetical protein
LSDLIGSAADSRKAMLSLLDLEEQLIKPIPRYHRALLLAWRTANHGTILSNTCSIVNQGIGPSMRRAFGRCSRSPGRTASQRLLYESYASELDSSPKHMSLSIRGSNNEVQLPNSSHIF